jgi:hypothetical protein
MPNKVDAKKLIAALPAAERTVWRARLSSMVHGRKGERDVPLALAAMYMYVMRWYEDVISCWRLLESDDCARVLCDYLVAMEHGRLFAQKLLLINHPFLLSRAQAIVTDAIMGR